LKIAEIRRDQPGPILKITDFFIEFWKFKKNKKNLKKYVKKLDEILRTLVEKFFQISTVLLDKIKIESET
jgi:hypothetical protein